MANSLFKGPMVIGVRCSLLSNGTFGLLLYTADTPERAKQAVAGQAPPDQSKLLLTMEGLDQLIQALQTAKDQAQSIASADGKGN